MAPRTGALPGWIASRAGLAVLAWLTCCAVMLWLHRSQFATLDFYDPDDALRLQQVRDWLGGQPFFDVSQHRVNPPAGGPMHWSRIVDMPIAALILLLRPFTGSAFAETMACAMVPLLLLGGTCWALYRAAARFGGRGVALAAVMLLVATPTILIQFGPFRIDHHGWQIGMAAIALAGAFARNPWRGGVICGLALAVWLQISSEGLPYAALFAGMLSLRFLAGEEHRTRLITFAATIGTGALILLALTKGPSAPFVTHCDALSAAYVWPLAAYSLATLITAGAIRASSLPHRLWIVLIGSGAAMAVFITVGGQCLSGDPFQALGPFAYKHWYLQVMEGRPIWDQDLPKQGLILLPGLIGLTGSLLAARRAGRGSEARANWLCLTLMLAGAMAIAVMVMRAMTVAHMMALPGSAWLILHLFQRIQASSSAIMRVFGSAALMALTPVGACALWAMATAKAETPSTKETSCIAASTLTPLKGLAPATLFAPLDIGPAILINTPHSVIATAHHRNAAGIALVIKGFMAHPSEARDIIGGLRGGRGVDYVVTCDTLNEFRYYVKFDSRSLAAQLSKGRHPDWLRPVPSTGPLKIYRVIAPSATKASATPFMQ